MNAQVEQPALRRDQKIDAAALRVLVAIRDHEVDEGEVEATLRALRALLPENVRVYELPSTSDLAIYFDGEPGDIDRVSWRLAATAAYIEAVHADGTATVVKDRDFEPGPLPMTTEPLRKG